MKLQRKRVQSAVPHSAQRITIGMYRYIHIYLCGTNAFDLDLELVDDLESFLWLDIPAVR